MTGITNSAFAALGDLTANGVSQIILTGKVDPKELIISGATSFVCSEAMRNAAKVITPRKTSVSTTSATASASDGVKIETLEGGNKTDFYVKPNGDVVPSTGYRYISENATYLDDISKNMTIPANSDGTYFSFDNYDYSNPRALQVPHDASVKVRFDTLQIIEDISVPFGNWGKATYLEPIAKDFPQFGNGGATQVITHSNIIVDSITKLR